MVKAMRKPKIKQYKNYYLVYTNKKQAVKCFDIDGARLWYNVLLLEQMKKKKPG
jgi:hypothetical protein